MSIRRWYAERPFAKTKIVATVGPACETTEQLERLLTAGVDLLRLNFAHAEHDWLADLIERVREISQRREQPVGILADLSGPKIRLGELPEEGLCCLQGGRFEFVREADPSDLSQLTCTYPQLIDDLQPGDRVVLADGLVSMRVVAKDDAEGRVVCEVEQPGLIRSRQGVNLPGVALSTPSLTEKDRHDLSWALEHRLDYVGLSFVRSADDIRTLRKAIEERHPAAPPRIVAKIEKVEAVDDFENILELTDAVMVARGDLGVEVDIATVPILQKQIIRKCNEHRIPVITATQMLDSMQSSELPTRAEVSDVANAVLDGSDAVMLSGETAIGTNPEKAVAMMSRIAAAAEQLLSPSSFSDPHSPTRTRATAVTEAVTSGAGTAAEHFGADLVVVATHSGRTAMALSKRRSRVPILALTDRPEIARQMCLFWGVTPVVTEAVSGSPQELLDWVAAWGGKQQILGSGSKLVLVGSTDWSDAGHDMLLVHVVP